MCVTLEMWHVGSRQRHLINRIPPVDVTSELAGHVESCAACERVLESIEDSPASLLPELRGVTPADISRAQRELGMQQSFGATGMMELRGQAQEFSIA